MSTTLGSIVVDLLARTGSFETDINRAAKTAEKRAKEIDAAVSKAGAAVGVALGAAGIAAVTFAKQMIDGLDALNDVKDATGSSIENISALEDTALRTGASLEDVSSILVKFNGALKEADGKNAVSQTLKAIGLDAQELKKLDPAEALRQTAVALTTFADDGNKARLVQELFGKSIKEAAPFLNDLAEKTELVGKVTGEQTANAEAFNKRLAELSKNALDAKRALLNDLLPAVNAVLKAMGERGIMGALDEFGNRAFDWEGNAQRKRLAYLKDEIAGLSRTVERKGMTPGELVMVRPQDVDQLAALRKELKETEQAYYKFNPGAGGGRGSINPPLVDVRESVGDINFKPNTPKTPKADKSGEQEAKAQLAYDLDSIRKGTDQLKGELDNREKVLEAQRNASLISEADYYEQKRKLVEEADQAEIDAAREQLKRLQEEQKSLKGKDAIDNDRKINDARAALAKAQGAAATNITVLTTQATASARRLEESMIDARVAAQSLLDTTNRSRALDVSGMGQGAKQRDYDAAISQIEQTYEQRRQDLERDNRNGKFKDRDDDYKRELALIAEFQQKSVDSFKAYNAQIDALQRSGVLGASEAAKNYFTESQNAYKDTEQAVSNAFKGMEDKLTEFVRTGKLDFKGLVDSILGDIARLTIRQNITGPLAGMLSDVLGGQGRGRGSSLTGDSETDFLTGLAGSSSAMRGAGGGSSGASWLSGLTSGFGSLVGSIFSGFGFADGGNPPVGKASVVGERGPELFIPQQAGTIIPTEKLEALPLDTRDAQVEKALAAAGLRNDPAAANLERAMRKIVGAAPLKAGPSFSGFGFQEGGSPPVGMASLVGERGPELFVPRQAGTIIPNHVLEGGKPNGGERDTGTHNYYFTVGDVATVSMVKKAVAAGQRQAAGAYARSQAYGGA